MSLFKAHGFFLGFDLVYFLKFLQNKLYFNKWFFMKIKIVY